jgi:hypothetical protein
MSSPNTIADLLARGAAPRDADAENLRALGAFVSSLVARLAPESRRTLAPVTDSMLARLARDVSAGGVAAWVDSLAVAGGLTAHGGLGVPTWGETREGYLSFEQELQVLQLMEDQPEAQPAEAFEQVERRSASSRRGSRRPGILGGRAVRPVTATRPAATRSAAESSSVSAPDKALAGVGPSKALVETRANGRPEAPINVGVAVARSVSGPSAVALPGGQEMALASLRPLVEGGLSLRSLLSGTPQVGSGFEPGSPLAVGTPGSVGSSPSSVVSRVVAAGPRELAGERRVGAGVDARATAATLRSRPLRGPVGLPMLDGLVIDQRLPALAASLTALVQSPEPAAPRSAPRAWALFDAADGVFVGLESERLTEVAAVAGSTAEAAGQPRVDAVAPSGRTGARRGSARAVSSGPSARRVATGDQSGLFALRDLVAPASGLVPAPASALSVLAASDRRALGGSVGDSGGVDQRVGSGTAQGSVLASRVPDFAVRPGDRIASRVASTPDGSPRPLASRSSLGGELQAFISLRDVGVATSAMQLGAAEGALTRGSSDLLGTAADAWRGSAGRSVMPLGASFSASEAFAVSAAAASGAGLAKGLAQAAWPSLVDPRAMRATWVGDAVDGAVWVVPGERDLPTDQRSTSPVTTAFGEPGVRRLGLALIPERPGAVLAPAALAAQAFWQAAVTGGAQRRAPGARGGAAISGGDAAAGRLVNLTSTSPDDRLRSGQDMPAAGSEKSGESAQGWVKASGGSATSLAVAMRGGRLSGLASAAAHARTETGSSSNIASVLGFLDGRDWRVAGETGAVSEGYRRFELQGELLGLADGAVDSGESSVPGELSSGPGASPRQQRALSPVARLAAAVRRGAMSPSGPEGVRPSGSRAASREDVAIVGALARGLRRPVVTAREVTALDTATRAAAGRLRATPEALLQTGEVTPTSALAKASARLWRTLPDRVVRAAARAEQGDAGLGDLAGLLARFGEVRASSVDASTLRVVPELSVEATRRSLARASGGAGLSGPVSMSAGGAVANAAARQMAATGLPLLDRFREDPYFGAAAAGPGLMGRLPAGERRAMAVDLEELALLADFQAEHVESAETASVARRQATTLRELGLRDVAARGAGQGVPTLALQAGDSKVPPVSVDPADPVGARLAALGLASPSKRFVAEAAAALSGDVTPTLRALSSISGGASATGRQDLRLDAALRAEAAAEAVMAAHAPLPRGLRALAERGLIPMRLADVDAIGGFVSLEELREAVDASGLPVDARRKVLDGLRSERAVGTQARHLGGPGQSGSGADSPPADQAPRRAGGHGAHARRRAGQDLEPRLSALRASRRGSEARIALPGAILGGLDASSSTASALTASAWRVLADQTPRTTRLAEALGGYDPAFVTGGGESVAAGGTADAPAASGTPGFADRIARALSEAAHGPAGATRLVGGAVRSGAGLASASAAGAAQQLVALGQSLEPGSRNASRTSQLRPSRAGWRASSAALAEETGAPRAAGLGAVLSPEVMLGGLRASRVTEAIREMVLRGAPIEGGRGVLTELTAAGLQLGDVGLESAGVGKARTSRAVESPTSLSRRLARMPRGERAALMSALLESPERAEWTSVMKRAGAADFAFEWLARVDGTRSGLPVDLGEAREATARTFGRLHPLAETSPVADANLVAQPDMREAVAAAAARISEGRATTAGAGVAAHARGVATALSNQATRSEAVRRTDWRLVDTGVKGAHGHADLGKLASALASSGSSVGTSGAASVPLALVAPAAQAVAQTALRAPRSEGRSSGPVADPAAPNRGGPSGPGEVTLSEAAIELLAIEMAARVAELFEQDNDRTGQWK